MARFIYSFVVDQHPKFAYQAWHLAQSLQLHCEASARDIHVHFTPQVAGPIVSVFEDAGYTSHRIQPFGDGRWCNKLAQLPNLLDFAFDSVILLDTDMIAVSDLRVFVSEDAVQAKIVDLPNPSFEILSEIYRAAGGQGHPQSVTVEASDARTARGNANGGFYAVPAQLAERFSREWRRWAEWLMENREPLAREGKLAHIDQVSAALTFMRSHIPFEIAPSNVNYFLHVAAHHKYLDVERPLALLHYHDVSMNVLGLLEPPIPLNPVEEAAVSQANAQIAAHFENTLFWSFRYASFPDRRSGIGSRGDNLAYKRDLLRAHGIEQARSILDIGCGDLEVIRDLDLSGYLGIDISPVAIANAREHKPAWNFAIYRGQGIEPKDMVLCFEVAIHQTNVQSYKSLVDFAAVSTLRTLFISGYDTCNSSSHMVHFHEPMRHTLEATGRFKAIEAIGSHTDVTIYRCDC